MSNAVKTKRAPEDWKILDRGAVPEIARLIDYTCLNCGASAELPVMGVPLAQSGHGIVFDTGPYATPKRIQCRHCGSRYEKED